MRRSQDLALFSADFIAFALSEYEVNGGHEANKCRHVVPVKLLAFEEEGHNHREHDERHHFLYDFQLYQTKRSSVVDNADALVYSFTCLLKN